jgi:hypothetical protein
VHALEHDVLLGEGGLELLAQDLRVEDVLHADADAGRLVRVRRPDPAPGRPDLQAAEAALAGGVDGDVPGHDQVGVAGDPDGLGRDAAALELVQLGDQQARVDDAARADDAELSGEDPRGDVVERERLPVEHDRVPGVRAALVAADDVRVHGEEVDDLPLALVAPLRSHDHGRRHPRQSLVAVSARRDLSTRAVEDAARILRAEREIRPHRLGVRLGTVVRSAWEHVFFCPAQGGFRDCE